MSLLFRSLFVFLTREGKETEREREGEGERVEFHMGGRWGGCQKSWGKEIYYQNILYEASIFSERKLEKKGLYGWSQEGCLLAIRN